MNDTITSTITPEIIKTAMKYDSYRNLVRERIENNQSTGTDHSESIVGFTKMNEQRMRRLDKTIKILPEVSEKLEHLKSSQIWLVITEGWCGDAAQTVPVIAKMANENPNIDLKFILRDEHLPIMDEFLTNGGRSIPKMIILDKETLSIEGTWGPRPAELQDIFAEAKKSPDFDYPEVQKMVQKWYNKNKGIATQEEIASIVTS